MRNVGALLPARTHSPANITCHLLKAPRTPATYYHQPLKSTRSTMKVREETHRQATAIPHTRPLTLRESLPSWPLAQLIKARSRRYLCARFRPALRANRGRTRAPPLQAPASSTGLATNKRPRRHLGRTNQFQVMKCGRLSSMPFLHSPLILLQTVSARRLRPVTAKS